MIFDDVDDFQDFEIPIEDKRFMELCYLIFETSPDGKELMERLKKRLLSPVAPYDKPPSYANFREGENNLVRTLSYCAIAYKDITSESK